MVTPENRESIRSLREQVTAKAQTFLGEPNERNSILFSGDGLLYNVALAVRGRTFERLGSLQISGGFQWVAITERSTMRFGSVKPNHLIVEGEGVGDSEGRSLIHFWHFDLYKNRYGEDEYQVLSQLLDSEEGQARDDLFYRLALIT